MCDDHRAQPARLPNRDRRRRGRGCVVPELGALVGQLSGGRIEVETFRLQNITADVRLPSCCQQIATSRAMKAGIVGYGLEDVSGIGGKRGEPVDHYIRRGRLDRCPHRPRIERIGTGRLGATFA